MKYKELMKKRAIEYCSSGSSMNKRIKYRSYIEGYKQALLDVERESKNALIKCQELMARQLIYEVTNKPLKTDK